MKKLECRGTATVVKPRKSVKLYFAILNKGWLRREFSSHQLNDMRNTPGVEFVWEDPALTVGHPICSVRNAIVKRFLKTDCDFLMMQDDDIVPLHNPAELPLADKDIIGSPAKVRQHNQQINWVAYMRVKGGAEDDYYPVDFMQAPSDCDLLPVDVVGTGLICVKRKVMESIKAPFMDTFTDDGIRHHGTDFAFCERAQAAGFEIFTTPHRVCEHLKEGGLLDLDGYDDSDNMCYDNYKYKIAWGNWAILQKDWRLLKAVIKTRGMKRVLEFGAGLSSLLMSEMAEVVSYETNVEWAKKIEGLKNGNALAIAMWDGRGDPLVEQRGPFDMAFIDGPRGDQQGREASFRAAAKAKVPMIICHDAGRRDEVTYQNRYLRENYKLTGKNGNHSMRCNVWELKDEANG
jgi:hypothetical protein